MSENSHARQADGGHGDLNEQIAKLLPTPMARTQSGTQVSGDSRTGGPMLEEALKLLPTPNASMANYEEDPETWEPRRAAAAERHGNNGIGMPLPIALKLLPTPRAQDAKHGAATEYEPSREPGLDALHVRLARVSQSSGASMSLPSEGGSTSTGLRLNPLFVEWMMGAPVCGECGRGWTDSDCPHSATAYTSTSAGSSARRSP